MAYIVTAPLVVTKKPDRSDLYLYEGAVVPAQVSKDELTRLAADGFIKQVSADEAAVAVAPVAESN